MIFRPGDIVEVNYSLDPHKHWGARAIVREVKPGDWVRVNYIGDFQEPSWRHLEPGQEGQWAESLVSLIERPLPVRLGSFKSVEVDL